MLFVITSTELCKDNFLARMCRIAMSHPDRIVYREKKTDIVKYRALAYDCQSISRLYDVPFSVDGDIEMARELKSDLQVSLKTLEEMPQLTEEFHILGVSVQNTAEAKKAEQLGASYLIAEDKEQGVESKNFALLGQIADAVQIPVLAMGNVAKDRIPSVYDSGAEGICSVYHFMQCPYDDIESDIFGLKNTDIENKN